MSFNFCVLAYLKGIFRNFSSTSQEEYGVTNRVLDHASAINFLDSVQSQKIMSDRLDTQCPSLKYDNIQVSDFLTYMASSEGDAMAPPNPRDTSQPISNYFISSSHNTYLPGHQLLSRASVEPYRNVCESNLSLALPWESTR